MHYVSMCVHCLDDLAFFIYKVTFFVVAAVVIFIVVDVFFFH